MRKIVNIFRNKPVPVLIIVFGVLLLIQQERIITAIGGIGFSTPDVQKVEIDTPLDVHIVP